MRRARIFSMKILDSVLVPQKQTNKIKQTQNCKTKLQGQNKKMPKLKSQKCTSVFSCKNMMDLPIGLVSL